MYYEHYVFVRASIAKIEAALHEGITTYPMTSSINVTSPP